MGKPKTFVYNSLCLNVSVKYHNIHNTYAIYAQIIEKEAMNLKDKKEGLHRGFGGGKRRGKCYNYITSKNKRNIKKGKH